MRRLIRHLFWPALCVLFFAAFGVRAATVADEAELKAAFVYNFTLFTTWPQPGKSLRICVLGTTNAVLPLKTYEGRSVNGATVRVEQVKSATEARSCQLLFIDTSEHENINSINKALAGAPVMLVAESGKLSPSLVHILLAKENDRVVFDVNQSAAAASGLDFSFKLLKLARKVYEGK